MIRSFRKKIKSYESIIENIFNCTLKKCICSLKIEFFFLASECYGYENYPEVSDVYSFLMIVYEIMNVENSFERITFFKKKIE